MKATWTLVASALAASAAALSSTNTAHRDVTFNPCTNKGKSLAAGEKEKYAPRFDGLRFIETLVTAHR